MVVLDFFGLDANLMDNEKGFKHNLQGGRVVSFLEHSRNGEPGLNLSRFTIWGIVNHTKTAYSDCVNFSNRSCFLKSQTNNHSKCSDGKFSLGFYKKSMMYGNKEILEDRRDWSFEAMIVALSDEIAQRHHDIEDGIYAGLFDYNELHELIFKKSPLNLKRRFKEKDFSTGKFKDFSSLERMASMISRPVIDFYINETIRGCREQLRSLSRCCGIKKRQDFLERRDSVYGEITAKNKSIVNGLFFCDELENFDRTFKNYLEDTIIRSELAQKMDAKAELVLRKLIEEYSLNPQHLPDSTINKCITNYNNQFGKKNVISGYKVRKELNNLLKHGGNDRFNHVLLRTICDYIAGMTDAYAMKQYSNLFGITMYDVKNFGFH